MKKQLLILALAWIPLLIGAADNEQQNLEQFHALLDDVQVIIAKSGRREIKDNSILIRNIPSGHEDWVNSVVFNNDGTKIVSASYDATIRIWDVNTKQSDVLRGHTDRVNSAVFNHNETKIVSASNDDTIRIWDVITGQSDILRGHEGPVQSAVFNHDGTKIVSASNDGTIRIWDVITGQSNVLHECSVQSVAFNHDGTKIVSATHNGKVYLWDVLAGQYDILYGREHHVESIDFNHDGTNIISVSHKGIIHIWDVRQLPYAQYHFSILQAKWFYDYYHRTMYGKDKQEGHNHDVAEISQEKKYQILDEVRKRIQTIDKLEVKSSIKKQYPEILSRFALKAEKELS